MSTGVCGLFLNVTLQKFMLHRVSKKSPHKNKPRTSLEFAPQRGLLPDWDSCPVSLETMKTALPGGHTFCEVASECEWILVANTVDGEQRFFCGICIAAQHQGMKAMTMTKGLKYSYTTGSISWGKQHFRRHAQTSCHLRAADFLRKNVRIEDLPSNAATRQNDASEEKQNADLSASSSTVEHSFIKHFTTKCHVEKRRWCLEHGLCGPTADGCSDAAAPQPSPPPPQLQPVPDAQAPSLPPPARSPSAQRQQDSVSPELAVPGARCSNARLKSVSAASIANDLSVEVIECVPPPHALQCVPMEEGAESSGRAVSGSPTELSGCPPPALVQMEGSEPAASPSPTEHDGPVLKRRKKSPSVPVSERSLRQRPQTSLFERLAMNKLDLRKM